MHERHGRSLARRADARTVPYYVYLFGPLIESLLGVHFRCVYERVVALGRVR